MLRDDEPADVHSRVTQLEGQVRHLVSRLDQWERTYRHLDRLAEDLVARSEQLLDTDERYNRARARDHRDIARCILGVLAGSRERFAYYCTPGV